MLENSRFVFASVKTMTDMSGLRNSPFDRMEVLLYVIIDLFREKSEF